jgi:regulator of protease activity HflC (stomatin/prohibitin superfamily)
MITKDNAVVTVDAVVYMQVTDAKKAVYDIQDPYNAVLQIALANLRSMI